MNRRLSLLLGALIGVTGPIAGATDVYFPFVNLVQQPAAVRSLSLYPLYVSPTVSAGFVEGSPLVRVTGTNGSVTISNLVPGTYRANFNGVTSITTNWFTIPDTNGLQNATNYISTSYVVPGSSVPAYSMGQSDRLFWRQAVLRAGTNTSFRTNSGNVYIDTQAGGGAGSSGLTNGQTGAVTLGTNGNPFGANFFSEYLSTNKSYLDYRREFVTNEAGSTVFGIVKELRDLGFNGNGSESIVGYFRSDLTNGSDDSGFALGYGTYGVVGHMVGSTENPGLAVATFGISEGGYSVQIGAEGLASGVYNSQTNYGVVGIASGSGKRVGGYFATPTSTGTRPLGTNAVLILDNGGSGFPLILGRTNANGAPAFILDGNNTVKARAFVGDGSGLTGISSGSATNVFVGAGNRIRITTNTAGSVYSAAVIDITNANTVFVDSAAGSDVTGIRGVREFPYQTIRAGQAASRPGDVIWFGGTFAERDLGSNNVTYYSPRAYLSYNGNAVSDSGGIFTDNPGGSWLGVFAGASNSMTYQILGNITATNLTGSFAKWGGNQSKLSVNVREIGMSNALGDVPAIVFLSDYYAYPYSATNADASLVLKCERFSGCLYLSEHFADAYSSLWTNTTFYLDRDSNRERPQIIKISGAEANNCWLFSGRPYNSITVFDVPWFKGGQPYTFQGSYLLDGFGYFHNGTTIFKGTKFIQNTNAASTLFKMEFGNFYADGDYTNSARIVFEDGCKVIGKAGNTNQLIKYTYTPGQVTNPPSFHISGTLEYANAKIDQLPTHTGPGKLVYVPMLTNLFNNNQFNGPQTITVWSRTNQPSISGWELGVVRTNGMSWATLYTSVSYDDSQNDAVVDIAVFQPGAGTTNFYSRHGIVFSDSPTSTIRQYGLNARLAPNDRYFVHTNFPGVVLEGPSYLVEE